MNLHSQNAFALLAGLILAVGAQASVDEPPDDSPRQMEQRNDVRLVAHAIQPAPVTDDWKTHIMHRPFNAAPSEAHLPTVEEWLSDVEQKVDRQLALFQRTVLCGLGLIAVLYCLTVGAMGYFWNRLRRLSVAASGPSPQSSGGTSAVCKELTAAHASNRGRLNRGTARRKVQLQDEESELEDFGLDDRRAGDGRIRNGLPQVRIHKGVVERLASGFNEWRRKHRDVETGYALVGKITGKGPSRIITICELIEAGPKARRLRGQVTFDREFQQQELCLLQMVDAEVMHIGDVHLHPGNLDRCSDGDYQTDVANVRDSRSQEMVFGIVTAGWTQWGRRADSSLWHAGLKLDFFYLGKPSGYVYQACQPKFVEGQSISVPGPLRKFANAFPERAVLEFDNLRRLRNYRMTLGMLPNEHGGDSPCIEMAHKTRNHRTMILFGEDPAQPPEVLVEIDGKITRFRPSYLNGQFLPVVWFTPIVLEIERALTERHGAVFGRNFPADTRSMCAGRKHPGPMGDSHGQVSTS